MRTFGYARPADAAQAIRAAAAPGAKYLGGGTNLVDLMKLGVETPELLIDVSALSQDTITATPGGGLLAGAAVRNSDLAVHPEVRRRYPVLSQAVLAGASGQLRNLATVGGNLLQRTRCGYFTDTSKPCNKRVPGSGCPAVAGEHHNHAILGASPQCVATNPSDMAVALMALDAVVHVQAAHGPLEIPVGQFYRRPGDTPEQETTLPPGALITGVQLPPLAFGARSAYRKARERASYAFAIGSVAAALDVADGTVRGVRLALGAVAPLPWRAHAAEQALTGRPATAAEFAAAADAELAAARPLRDNGYKIPLLRNMIVSVLEALAGQEAGLDEWEAGQ